MSRYNYLLTITDDETGEELDTIEAISLDSLKEKMESIPELIREHEHFNYGDVDLNPESERHND